MRSRNGVMVSCKGDCNAVKKAEFTSKREQMVYVKNNFESEYLKVTNKGTTTNLTVKKGEIFSILVDGKVTVTG